MSAPSDPLARPGVCDECRVVTVVRDCHQGQYCSECAARIEAAELKGTSDAYYDKHQPPQGDMIVCHHGKGMNQDCDECGKEAV